MNHSQHDELAQLFSQRMQLSQQQQQPVLKVQTNHIGEKQGQAQAPPVHFISTHYTPNTHHIRLDTTNSSSPSPPPAYQESQDLGMPEAMAETLRQNSIDPYALLPNQVHLFQNADYEQRLRLLELWRIAPPVYDRAEEGQYGGVGKWVPTSVEKEEVEARARYEERQQHEQKQQRRYGAEEHMLDTHLPPSAAEEEPMSPIREPGEPAWPPAARMRAASIAASRTPTRPASAVITMNQAEPYILSGYERSAPEPFQRSSSDGHQYEQHVDPVHAAAAGMGMMEHQYGMYEQIRNHADWEAMNERMARENFAGLHGPLEMQDDDMEL